MASSSSPAGQQRAAASPPAHTAAAPPAAAAAPTPAATAAPTATVYWTPAGAAEGPVSPAGPQPVAPGLPLPVALPQGPVGQLRAPPVVAPLPAVAPALCAYCHAPHSMRECREFHAMLQALYQVRAASVCSVPCRLAPRGAGAGGQWRCFVGPAVCTVAGCGRGPLLVPGGMHVCSPAFTSSPSLPACRQDTSAA